MRILILGITGMLGNTVFKKISQDPQHEVWGTFRNEKLKSYFTKLKNTHILSGVDVLDQANLVAIINHIHPDIVINCTGIIKQLDTANNPLIILPINSLFPHQLANLCSLVGARLIQLSTDCVFSGRKGYYKESDISDAEDLYGKSKFIGELHHFPHAITLRTSGIGHELKSHNGLVEWFLSQKGSVKGYAQTIYSGLPSVELAHVIKDFVMPHPELHGLYHVSAKPIAKLDLLKLVAKIYSKDIEIIPDNSLVADRSLNSEKFTKATGYIAPEWPELIQKMYNDRSQEISHVR